MLLSNALECSRLCDEMFKIADTVGLITKVSEVLSPNEAGKREKRHVYISDGRC
jgi:hypothetical protein